MAVATLLLVSAGAAMAAGTAAEKSSQSQGAKTKAAKKPAIDPRADGLMHQMSDFLLAQKTFTVKPESSVEIVDDNGQKLQLQAASEVALKRPDKLKVERAGDLADAEFFVDGKNLTVYAKNAKVYASTPILPTIDDAMDMAEEKLGFSPPGADLLSNDPYGVMMADVISGRDLGDADIHGVSTRHLAFRSKDVDWQIWIQNGDQPLPRKLVVTSKKSPQAPQYSVELHDWKLNPELSDDQFAFKPPAGVARISFLSTEKQAAPKKSQARRKGETR